MPRPKVITRDKAPPSLMFSVKERAQAFLQVSSQIILLTDAEGNPKDDVTLWCEYTGQSLEDVLNGKWIAAFHPDDRERIARTWGAALKTQEAYEIEYRLLKADGRYRSCVARSAPVRAPDGRVVEWVHCIHDISEQQVLETALLLSERRFRATFEQAAVGIAHIGLDGSWLLVNEKLCLIVGYSREELSHMTFQDITYAEDLDADLNNVHCLLTGELSTYAMEKRYRHKNGSLVWINLTVSLVRDQQGEPAFFISVVEEINDRKRIEQDIVRRTAQLEEMNHVLSNFVSIVSHEFRTTLTSIQGFSELLCSEAFSPEESQEYAHDIFEDAKRLRRMIDNLLDLERMKQGFTGLHVEEVEVNGLLREVVQRIRLTASLHTILLQLVDDEIRIEGDRDKLIQVVMNLLTNAIKYAPEGGEILIASERQEEGVHMSVHDCGIGIPKDSLEKIFVPYHRVTNTSTQYIQGTGLGLPIVRQIAQMHGGWVWAESELGQGSTFHIFLPWKIPASSSPNASPKE